MSHLSRRMTVLLAAVLLPLSLLAGLAGSAGAASAAVPALTASAAVPDGATGYAYNQVLGIASAVASDVGIAEHTTVSSSRSQIWINGKPSCTIFGVGLVTWCGVAGGNGTIKLDTGLDYQARDNAGTLHKYYLRFDLYATGQCVVSSGDFNGYFGLSCRQ